MRRRLVVALAIAVGAVPALAEPCRDAKGKNATAPCFARAVPAAKRFEPYDPAHVTRPGRTPGFVDLGNGTEVRVSGRVRLDYDVRR